MTRGSPPTKRKKTLLSPRNNVANPHAGGTSGAEDAVRRAHTVAKKARRGAPLPSLSSPPPPTPPSHTPTPVAVVAVGGGGGGGPAADDSASSHATHTLLRGAGARARLSPAAVAVRALARDAALQSAVAQFDERVRLARAHMRLRGTSASSASDALAAALGAARTDGALAVEQQSTHADDAVTSAAGAVAEAKSAAGAAGAAAAGSATATATIVGAAGERRTLTPTSMSTITAAADSVRARASVDVDALRVALGCSRAAAERILAIKRELSALRAGGTPPSAAVATLTARLKHLRFKRGRGRSPPASPDSSGSENGAAAQRPPSIATRPSAPSSSGLANKKSRTVAPTRRPRSLLFGAVRTNRNNDNNGNNSNDGNKNSISDDDDDELASELASEDLFVLRRTNNTIERDWLDATQPTHAAAVTTLFPRFNNNSHDDNNNNNNNNDNNNNNNNNVRSITSSNINAEFLRATLNRIQANNNNNTNTNTNNNTINSSTNNVIHNRQWNRTRALSSQRRSRLTIGGEQRVRPTLRSAHSLFGGAAVVARPKRRAQQLYATSWRVGEVQHVDKRARWQDVCDDGRSGYEEGDDNDDNNDNSNNNNDDDDDDDDDDDGDNDGRAEEEDHFDYDSECDCDECAMEREDRSQERDSESEPPGVGPPANLCSCGRCHLMSEANNIFGFRFPPPLPEQFGDDDDDDDDEHNDNNAAAAADDDDDDNDADREDDHRHLIFHRDEPHLIDDRGLVVGDEDDDEDEGDDEGDEISCSCDDCRNFLDRAEGNNSNDDLQQQEQQQNEQQQEQQQNNLILNQVGVGGHDTDEAESSF